LLVVDISSPELLNHIRISILRLIDNGKIEDPHQQGLSLSSKCKEQDLGENDEDNNMLWKVSLSYS
jgi:hypothetical protein